MILLLIVAAAVQVRVTDHVAGGCRGGRAADWRGAARRGAARRLRGGAETCARADRQHSAVLAGDELVSFHGDYPPAA
jgi:hypothetical protein